jgi:hypothetical protein
MIMAADGRNIGRASYAPSGNSEFVKQAVAQQRVSNRSARAAGALEERTPILGKNAGDTQQLKEHAAATTIQSFFRSRQKHAHLKKGLGMAKALNARDGTLPHVEADKQMLREALPRIGEGFAVDVEKSHAAAMVMPQAGESLGRVRHDAELTILGHGSPGTALLGGTPGHTVGLNKVAQDLRAGGLSPDHQNVRMSSCSSADALRRTAFVAAPPDKERPASWKPDFFNPEKTAPAKTMANELKAAGFRGTTVTGFQGLGVQNPQGLTAERQLGRDATTRRAAQGVAHTFHAD